MHSRMDTHVTGMYVVLGKSNVPISALDKQQRLAGSLSNVSMKQRVISFPAFMFGKVEPFAKGRRTYTLVCTVQRSEYSHILQVQTT